MHRFTVRNKNGVVLEMTDFGAKINALWVPDSHGNVNDVVLGFDRLADYRMPNHSIGATIGRVANRIRDARFELDGVTYELTANEGDHMLHGGAEFENVIWGSETVSGANGAGVKFRYRSVDGSFGFPGNVDAEVAILLSADNAVSIRFKAVTDAPTHVNMTHHGYFNLNGAVDTVNDHVLSVAADRYLVLDDTALPTGEIALLHGEPWDLSRPTRLGDRMHDLPQGGYHHNYIVNKPSGALAPVATLTDPSSGRCMQVATTQPSVVLYAAMGLDGTLTGKRNTPYGPYLGLCIETQHHVDAPNCSNFPSTVLRPGDTYDETVVYRFGVTPAR